jgi:hypothetical protein
MLLTFGLALFGATGNEAGPSLLISQPPAQALLVVAITKAPNSLDYADTHLYRSPEFWAMIKNLQ